ncbi:hypothetical protein ACFSQT_11390 [Mesorhizobium calcicola]|uniref:Uncharacterized protein n=1 Tax=Mesorhizobium calcicola TaxID=1300310 RepID=A0ABW4WBU6_9HYPH
MDGLSPAYDLVPEIAAYLRSLGRRQKVSLLAATPDAAPELQVAGRFRR